MDLAKTLQADGYESVIHKDTEGICNILCHVCEQLNLPFTNIIQLTQGIRPGNCWKYFYYTKNDTWINENILKRKNKDKEKYLIVNTYDIDEAVVYYLLSNLSSLSCAFYITSLCVPDYNNVLPRNNGVTDRLLKQTFNQNLI